MNAPFVIRLQRQHYAQPNAERLIAMRTEAREIERAPKCSWSTHQHCRWMLAQATLTDLVTFSSEYRDLT